MNSKIKRKTSNRIKNEKVEDTNLNEFDYLDEEEKELLEPVENSGNWKSVENKELKKFREAAKESMKKNKRINIRLTMKDYKAIQIKAMEEGIPYQTLISSIIHKYNKGQLKSTSL